MDILWNPEADVTVFANLLPDFLALIAVHHSEAS